MKHLLLLLRPHQWLKNAFVFLPLFFAGHIGDVPKLTACALAFLAYSLAASAIYCFNDIWDVEADRQHPTKCHRPIASGAIAVPTAYGLMTLCVAASFGVTFLMENWGVILARAIF